MAVAGFFRHVLALPPGLHRNTRSGQLMGVLLRSTDRLREPWLTCFREHFANAVARILMLPVAVRVNWRLGLGLLVLMGVFAKLSLLVITRMHDTKRRVDPPKRTSSSQLDLRPMGRWSASEEARGPADSVSDWRSPAPF